MSQTSLRRTLNFTTLDDAVADVRHLLATGYTHVGKWNLAETLEHCSLWLRFPLEGYPATPFPLNLVASLARITIGGRMRRQVLQARGFPPGSMTLPSTVKVLGRDQDAAAVEQFVVAVEKFKNFRGTPQASPLFGNLSYEEHRELQVIHLQHHLSFLWPAAGDA
jgi:hypothetical protein